VLVNTNKIANGANNPTRIQSAINNNTGNMGFLKPFLTTAQITDIAAYLGNPGLVGVGTPAAAISPASLTFASTNVGSTSAAQTVTLANSGTASLSISSIASSNAAFKVSGGTCAAGGSVAAGASCTVTLAFAPSAAGATSGSLTLTHNASPTTSSVALSGTGVVLAPVAAVTPASLAFTQVLGSASAAQTATLSNSGNAPLSVSALTLGGAQASEFAIAAGSTCAVGTSVAPGASCSIAISFNPAATGTRSASLAITSNGSASPLAVALSGTGTAVPVPVIALNQNALQFASQALGSRSATQTISVSNAGQATLQLSAITLGGANASDFVTSGTCAPAGTLAVGASCSIDVAFAPSALGTRSASVAIGSDGGSASVTLGGNGVAAPAPVVSLSPTAVSFGNATVSAAAVVRSVGLSNTGTATLTIAGVSTSGSGFGATSGCGASLAPGASCSITVSFAPGTVGALAGVLSVASDAAGSPHQVALDGQGVSVPLPVLAWGSAPSATFVDTAVGSRSAPQSLTLTNQGPGSVTLNALSLQGAQAGDFIAGGSCAAGAVLAAGAGCSVSVVFAPSQIGARTATLDVASTGSAPAPLTLAGKGVATAQSTLALSVPSVTFPVVTAGSPPAPVPVILSNAGTAALTVSAITFDSVGFSAQPSSQNGCPLLPFTLSPGQQCAIDIVLAATAPGDLSATMTVASDAAVRPQPLAVRASIAPASVSGSISNVGAGGCSIAAPGAPTDPLLPVLAAAAALVLAWRRAARAPQDHDERLSSPGDCDEETH
jgi:hypothetical protein